MSNKKPQNSILVLATLGVYLGLVLAGATPQVLASAAMTRQFDVKDEIEFKDDLDTKPDDERSPVATSVQIYLEDVEYFLENLGSLTDKGKNDFDVAAVEPRFSFDLDRNSFFAKIAVKNQSPERAFELAHQLDTTFDLYSTRATDKLRKTVIQLTTFRTENDQVFVITRLPRAGLTSLLK